MLNLHYDIPKASIGTCIPHGAVCSGLRHEPRCLGATGSLVGLQVDTGRGELIIRVALLFLADWPL